MTAITSSTTADGGRRTAEDGRRRRRRGLWQAPLFVLGVGALAAVAAARPTAGRGGAGPLGCELAEARRLLDRPDGDAAEAARRAQRALEEAGPGSPAAAEARFLLGGALERLAERGGPGAETAAAGLWAAARTHLEIAERLGVAEADDPRLQLRLGKALFHTQDDPLHVVARLKPAVERLPRDDADLVDGYDLLSRAYERLGKVDDLREALAWNKKLRDLPQAREDVLPSARLFGGELQLRLGDAEGARRSLERVGAQAPAEVQGRARLLAALSYEGEGRWDEATALWKKALPEAARPAEVLYHLGVCAGQERPAEAAGYWEKCLQEGAGGDEAAAAALGLAELRLRGDAPETALGALTLAVGNVKSPDEWKNQYKSIQDVQLRFSEAARAYTEAKRYDLVLTLADAYARVGPPGEVARLRAEAAAAWGEARREKARQAPAGGDRRAEEEAARDLFRRAAAAYAAAADAADPAGREDLLWQSARYSREAGDVEAAAAKLDRYLRLENVPEARQGEGWYWLGEARRGLNDPAGACAAYVEAVRPQHPTRYAYLARYQLAVAARDKGRIDEAAAHLEQNLKLLRVAADPDPEAEQKSLYALGDLEYQRKRYAEVERRLGEALGRFKDDPGGTRARFELAMSYRLLADQSNVNAALGAAGAIGEETRAKKWEEHQRYLSKAAEEFKGLARFLQTEQGRGGLTPEEAAEVPFRAADCLFDHGDYKEALQVYEGLNAKYAGQPNRVAALGGMVRCHSAQGDNAKVKQLLEEIRELVKTMPEDQKQQWSQWLSVAAKPVTPVTSDK
jgi:tetratricopeptide (TPR) repeat protein